MTLTWVHYIHAMVAAESRETVSAEARRLGLSERQVYRIRAKERAGRVAWASAPAERLDPHDYTYMELVSARPESGQSRYEWITDSGVASQDHGRYNIAGRVRSLRYGVITTEDSSRTDGKPQPTAYAPMPGLKGGKS